MSTTAPTTIEPTPWERRSELGRAQGFFQTLKRSTLEPSQFCPSIDPDRSAYDAFLYGWLVSAMTGLGAIPFLALNLSQMQVATIRSLASNSAALQGIADLYEFLARHPVASAIVAGLSTPVLYPLTLVVSAALTHVGVRVMGTTHTPFSTTLRCNCYSSGPNLFAAIPAIGSIASAYTLVLRVWMVRNAHGLTTARAIAVVIWPTVTLVCFGCSGGVLIAALALSKA